MSEASTIQRLQASIAEGPAWHGPAVAPLLEDVSAADAATHPIPGVHSIWELVLHIDAWQQFAIRALQHEIVEKLSADADWPRVTEQSDASWKATIDRFKMNNQKLRALLDGYDDAALRGQVPGRDHTIKVMLYGLSHHNAYHAGQIAILKRSYPSG